MSARVHLLTTGTWANCTAGDSCAEPFHVPDVTPAQAYEIPGDMLEQLFEAFDPPTQTRVGKRIWLDRQGLPHRDYGMPAIIDDLNGSRTWMQHGQIGRLADLPSVIDRYGARIWYLNGEPGRINDQPNYITADGVQSWRPGGQWNHRVGGPAVVEPGGMQMWYDSGELHRADGPAVIDPVKGVEQWWRRGKLHRGDGPAVIHTRQGTLEWWEQGELIAERSSSAEPIAWR